MNEFRVLGLRPLNGTSDQLKKNLENQIIYKFYQDYRFVDDNQVDISEDNKNTEIIEVKVIFPKKNIDIYSSDDLNISISAIVGQNGSGKSTLIDFYNLILYYLACNEFKTMSSTHMQALADLKFLVHFTKEYYSEIVNYHNVKNERTIDFALNISTLEETDLLSFTEDLISILEFRGLLIYKEFKDTPADLNFTDLIWKYTLEAKNSYGITSSNSSHKAKFAYQELNNSLAKKLRQLVTKHRIEKTFNDTLENEFNFQIFYQIGNEICKIEKIGPKVSLDKDKIFYTILLNYSLHSMNSKSLGNWIFKLFHKNDGYQTPNVINPYRKNGNIDVNSELQLSADRLVYNIIDQCRNNEKTQILKKYKFKKFIFKLKETTRYSLSELPVDYRNREEFLGFLAQIPSPYRFEISQNGILDYCLGYLIKKFRKIAMTYMDHFYAPADLSGMDFESQVESLERWRSEKAKEFLLTSNSHVAAKFNQTYNFLVNYDILNEKLKFLNKWDITKEIHLSQKNLRKWISFAQNELELWPEGTYDLIMNLFPAIFSIDIEFEKNGKPIKLSHLSSGEQQYIFNINTITYHINNLKTVKPAEGTSIKKYEHVNIILDEIELYYHPEYQKRLVKDLIHEIKLLDSLHNLKNFNILFLTHSPFILSDIPNQNILRLTEGKPSPKKFEQTFGANIHDLLANDFFLEGFMGEFAKSYIKKIFRKIDNISDAELNEKTYKKFMLKINLIGEPVIKNSLKSFLDTKFTDIIDLKKRRKELKKEMSMIKSKLKENGTD